MAAAAPSDDSEALGQFLGGNVLDIDLDDIAAIEGALAENPSGDHPSVNAGLDVSVLQALDIDLGSIDLLGENGIIVLGAAEQRADAEDDGDAYAGSGAVTDEGAIAIDENPDPDFASASVSLSELLEDTDIIETLALEIGALAATAAQVDGGTPTSEYMIADLVLNLDSPLVEGLYTSLQSTVTQLTTLLGGLESGLEADLDLDVAGLVSASVNATVTLPDLNAILTSLGSVTVDGITVSLATGTVSVDLEAFLAANSLDLNDLPANTELLNGALLADLTTSLVDTITGVVQTAVDSIVSAVENTPLAATVELDLLLGAAGIDLTIGGTIGSPTFNASTSGLAALVDQLLAALGVGTVDDLLDDVEGILDGLLGAITDALGGLTDPATGIVAGIADDVVAPVVDLVGQIVQLTVNVQPTEAGGVGDLGGDSFTVRALTLELLPGDTETAAATINLASATVRGTDAAADPGEEPGEDPGEPGDPGNDPGNEPGSEPSDPGDVTAEPGGEPGDPSDPADLTAEPGGDPADPGSDPAATDPSDGLASTGSTTAGLIPLGVFLLIAGAGAVAYAVMRRRSAQV